MGLVPVPEGRKQPHHQDEVEVEPDEIRGPEIAYADDRLRIGRQRRHPEPRPRFRSAAIPDGDCHSAPEDDGREEKPGAGEEGMEQGKCSWEVARSSPVAGLIRFRCPIQVKSATGSRFAPLPHPEIARQMKKGQTATIAANDSETPSAGTPPESHTGSAKTASHNAL